MKNIIKLSILFIFMSSFIPDLSAIPAFARKYKMSCMTCHSPAPRLKDYGNDFAGNGFRISDQDAPRYFVETGDDLLSLIRDFPIAVRIDLHLKFNNDNTRTTDFGSPYLLKLLSGGELSKRLSYYFYFYFDERGAVVGIEDAYLHYNNMFNSEFDIAVGQFSVSDPLFKSELRLTLEDYVIYKQRIGNSNARLSYDRGFMFTYSLNFGMDMAFEIVNGNGLSDADAQKIFDSDDCKNMAGRISQSLGENFRIGAFGYYGNEMLDNYDKGTYKNTLYYLGPDMTLSFGDIVEFNVQYLYRKDKELLKGSDMAFLKESNDTTTYHDVISQGGFAELIFTPKGDKSRWYMVALYNLVDSDFSNLDYQSFTYHLGYLVRRNIRFVGEFTADFTKRNHTYGKGSIGVVAAF